MIPSHMLEGYLVARSPKPWYREDRQAWFVTINGDRHNLGSDEKEAKRKFHELMAAPIVEVKKPDPDVLLVLHFVFATPT